MEIDTILQKEDRQAGRQAGRQADRQAETETDRQRDRDRQTDRQIDRQTESGKLNSTMIAVCSSSSIKHVQQRLALLSCTYENNKTKQNKNKQTNKQTENYTQKKNTRHYRHSSI